MKEGYFFIFICNSKVNCNIVYLFQILIQSILLDDYMIFDYSYSKIDNLFCMMDRDIFYNVLEVCKNYYCIFYNIKKNLIFVILFYFLNECNLI